MENNVLGIKIFRNVSGLTELFQYNSSALLEKGCEDNVREIYACVPDSQKNLPLILLTGMQEGYFITVLRYKKVERPDDSTSAWIYVPASVKVSGKELASIVESVNQILMSDRIDQQRLTEIFSRKYEVTSGAKTCFKSAGSEYAYRFFGPNAEYSLSEILNDMNQPVYKNYKRVILLDNALGQKLTTGHNVSNQRILERCVIAAPEPVDGFKPYYRDIPFNKPLLATEMDKFTIVWKKDGFKSIEKSYVASKDCVCTPPLRSEMKVLIPYSSIVVRGNGRILSDYTLIVNKALVKQGDDIEISVDAASSTQISVTAEGFNEYKDVHDLTSGRLEIKLANKAYTYDFLVYSSSQNDKVEFTCSFKTALRKSPLDGYEMVRSKKDPKRVYLEYRMFTKKVIIILFSLSLLFLAGGAAGGWFMSKSYYEADETTAAPATPETSATTPKVKNVTTEEPSGETDEEKKDREEAKRKADEEAKRRADAEAKRKAEADARRKADEEAKRKADAEAKRNADAEAQKKLVGMD